MSIELESRILTSLRRAKEAARALALSSTEAKNAWLRDLASTLRKSEERILAANRDDLTKASAAGIRGAMLDRLTLDKKRIEAIAVGVDQVAALPDPVGEAMARWDRPNG